MTKNKAADILSELEILLPYASCELDYQSEFQLLIAVVLSAQTTDKRVNIVTKKLFQKYGTAEELAQANFDDIFSLVKSLGLAKTKAQNIIALSKMLISNFSNEIPKTIAELTLLAGVGRKTASVMLVEAFKIPAMPVDTHVERIAKRLGFANENDDIKKVENNLKKVIATNRWIKAHHLFIHFGRYYCLAKKPLCGNCNFKDFCRYYKKKTN
ncbi:MAG: endonuclease III [Erysipelotrichaceae bacterium]